MPMLTTSEMHKVHSLVSSAQRAKEKARELAKEHAEDAKVVGETVGAAIVAGFVRGKMEAADGSFNIPGTTIDMELVAGLGLIGAGVSRQVFGKHSADAIQAGSGILAHYAGQISRKFAKTGQFSLVAGE